jgi:hypothetical protein
MIACAFNTHASLHWFVHPLVQFLDLDHFAMGSNAAKLPVGRGHSRPRAADKLEENK